METVLILLIQLGLPLLFLGFAFFLGNWVAKRHDLELARRGEKVTHIACSDFSDLRAADPRAAPPALITAEITMGIDHFRGFLGKLKNIIGGEVKSYQKTLDRARREALMQLMEAALAAGHNRIANLRMEFVDISGNANLAKKASMVTILAYGTAWSAAAES